MPQNTRIVYVAILVEDGDRFAIEDIINELIRPAEHDSQNSGVIDYAFNSDGNCKKLPESIPFTKPYSYQEGDFLKAIPPLKK